MENKCSGRCEECSINQRTYCASQMAYYAQQEIAEIKAIIASSYRKDEDGDIVLLRRDDEPEEEEPEEIEA